MPCKNLSLGIWRQWRPRLACVSAQSDQGLHCPLIESWILQNMCVESKGPAVSLCTCSGWFESSHFAYIQRYFSAWPSPYNTKWVSAWQSQRNGMCPQQSYRSAWAIRPVLSESSLWTQWVAKDPSFLHADCEDWSGWADAQADLSLHWAHMSFCWFLSCTGSNVMCKLLHLIAETWEIWELFPKVITKCNKHTCVNIHLFISCAALIVYEWDASMTGSGGTVKKYAKFSRFTVYMYIFYLVRSFKCCHRSRSDTFSFVAKDTYILISSWKHMLWVFSRSISVRHFKWVLTKIVFLKNK